MKESLFSYNEVLKASEEYFEGDEFAAKVFVDKYALQNGNGEFLEKTPEDMHKRLAKEFARIEKNYPNPLSEETILSLLDRFTYIIPQGSPMSAIGNPYQLQSISNCFVIDGVHSEKYDSYGGIMLADQELAQIMKRRGGVGLDISGIRPKGLFTDNAAKTTDGIAVFMERFSNTCREVAQNGRRGAEMQTISINHPEIETFINIKRDLKKVTGANISIRVTDEFMNAVEKDEDFYLRWPVDSKIEDAKLVKKVKAKDIWNQIIDSAWASAEPGVLFWDTVQKNTPSDIYAAFGHKSISTNPCFSGNTLIAVADGRNAVTIKQLAEEGKDVPVYSVDPLTGNISIKIGRHPRLTGNNKKLLRVFLDDNSYFDVTPDHKCLLKDGTFILAKDLQRGMSLPRFSKNLEPVKPGGKDYYRVNLNTNNQTKKIFEHRLIAKFFNQKEWNEIYNKSKKDGFVNSGGLVVHHKDFNSLNNNPNNLEIMSFKDHKDYHASIDFKGENNSNYSGISSDEIKKHAINLTKKLGRRFSYNDWINYASENNLPKTLSKFRTNSLGTILNLAKQCAYELGFKFLEHDPRTVKNYNNLLSQGYNANIIGNKVFVKKTCEICNNKFEIISDRREASFCSINCVSKYLNKLASIKDKRNESNDKYHYNKMIEVKNNQARVYSQLKFDLNRDPTIKEWEMACKLENLSTRINSKSKFGFKNFKEVADAGNNYNHKVVSIMEIDGEHDVYNITVDDNHTVGVITSQNNTKTPFSGVFLPQCGEIVLPANDACRLLAINLFSYVKNPFTKDAFFDFDLFKEHAIIAQRLMDDIIDLEIESINRIISKIENDPQPEFVKSIELNLWKKILNMNISGRRTGLGVTALGDALAALNIKYGTTEAVNKTNEIYKALAVGSHTSSCIMAKERGAFPIFNYELEKDHKYLQSIFDNCSEEVKLLWKNYGRRNIANTTTAPTGSVSSVARTSSGIEPVFLLSFVRRKKHNPSDKNAKIDFVDDLGDSWQEFTIYHNGLNKWMNVTGEKDITKSPYYGATANEIDWIGSVKMQAAAQKYVDHSISKTCVTSDTLIETDLGLLYMDEIIDFSNENYSLENEKLLVKNNEGNFVKPSHIHTMGKKSILKITLDNGLLIKVTPREQFLSLNDESGIEEWKYIEDLSIGDRVKLG